MVQPTHTNIQSARGIEEAVGRTPLVEIPTGMDNPAVRLFGKLEGNNPGSSVKDRAARWMILAAEAAGDLRPGMRLVEPTSGNTGIALAMIAAARGYPIELVMPASASAERVRTMQALGAEVILTPKEKSMEGAIDFAKEKAQNDQYLMLNQFANVNNPQAHYESTGPEIWNDTAGQVTHFVSAMGTTGTIMGVSRYLKEQDPSVQIIGCQPTEGSRIPGIRRWPKDYLPKFFEPHRVDRTIDVSQEDAERQCRWLASEVGLFCGVSAAGASLVAQRVCSELESGIVVTIICDRGDRYLSTPVFQNESRYWNRRYTEKKTGWDREGIHPALNNWLQQECLKQGSTIIIPGCGRGHEVIELARQGFVVQAIDFAEEPVQHLQTELASRQLTAQITQQNIFDFQPKSAVDIVYEQTCLCAIPPQQRQAYERTVYQWLRPGGHLFALFAQTEVPAGPPYHCGLAEMRELFPASRWVWPTGEPLEYEHPSNALSELAFQLTRR